MGLEKFFANLEQTLLKLPVPLRVFAIADLFACVAIAVWAL